MKKIEYEVTDKAGQYVAGVRSPGAGASIMLTEEQAHYGLIAGELRLPPETKKETVPEDEAPQETPAGNSTKSRSNRRKSENKG